MQRITDMTCGKPAQLIFFFSLPLMLGGVFQQLYMIVDTIIVGLRCRHSCACLARRCRLD